MSPGPQRSGWLAKPCPRGVREPLLQLLHLGVWVRIHPWPQRPPRVPWSHATRSFGPGPQDHCLWLWARVRRRGSWAPSQSWPEALLAPALPGAPHSAPSHRQAAVPRTKVRRQRTLVLGPQPRLLQGWQPRVIDHRARWLSTGQPGAVGTGSGLCRGKGQATGRVCPAAVSFPALC